MADTYHCAQLVFVQYLIDPIDTSFTTRVRNNVLSESIRNAHIGAPFISFDGFSVIHGSTKIMMFSSTAGDSAHLNNKGETRYSRVRLIKPWSYKLSHVLQRYQYCRIYLINYVNDKPLRFGCRRETTGKDDPAKCIMDDLPALYSCIRYIPIVCVRRSKRGEWPTESHRKPSGNFQHPPSDSPGSSRGVQKPFRLVKNVSGPPGVLT